MNFVILDDEIAGCDALTSALNFFPNHFNQIWSFQSIEKCRNHIENNSIDVLFLDIQMPEMSGFEFLTSLEEINFKVVFFTAYNKYLLDALRWHAFDYLLKPLDLVDLENCLIRLSKEKPKFEKEVFQSIFRKDKIAISTGDGFLIVKLSDIKYIKSDDNYSEVNLITNETVLSSKHLKDFERHLGDKGFYRIHQTYLVNLECIKSYSRQDGGIVTLLTGENLPISRRKKEGFLGVFR
jgi:two-component system, LytTR family, response regulator